MSSNKVFLYFHTIRYLKLTQIKYRIYYLIRNQVRKVISFSYQEKEIANTYNSIFLERSLPASKSIQVDSLKFSFLNLEESFNQGIQWNHSTHGKLWTYNLNYFEFLHTEKITKKEGLDLIWDFIKNKDLIKDGFEPYPISLRCIHWIKFLVKHQISNKKIDTFLFNQLLQLVDKREYHILGNHLLENGFSLLFGAYYFNDKTLYKKAKDILLSELKEQILIDGAHFELSPMYHQLMLYRVLDCINLIKNNIHFNKELLRFLRIKAEIMLGWLNQMTFSNGDIPLLNDSASNVNPTTSEIKEYSKQLGIKSEELTLKESGYRKIKKGNYEIIVDVGKIGPDYLPGHSHNDIFTFILYINQLPFIIDTGISTYNSGSRRNIERSTESHNTVKIGQFEQAQIWESFRVAKRNHPNILIDSLEKIQASLNYPTTNAKHIRTFVFDNSQLQLLDEVESSLEAKAFLHFHPDINVYLNENQVISDNATIYINGAEKIELEEFHFAPEFNKTFLGKKVVISFYKNLETLIILN